MCPVTHLNWQGLSRACLVVYSPTAHTRSLSHPVLLSSQSATACLHFGWSFINHRKTVAGNVMKLLYRADVIFIQL